MSDKFVLALELQASLNTSQLAQQCGQFGRTLRPLDIPFSVSNASQANRDIRSLAAGLAQAGTAAAGMTTQLQGSGRVVVQMGGLMENLATQTGLAARR